MSLICTEPFNYAVGGLNGKNGGTGWNGAWVEQNGGSSGYEIFSPGLTFTQGGQTLQSSANKAGGGFVFEGSGRALDVSGAFSAYATGGLIGLNGTTLYFSSLWELLFSGGNPALVLHADSGSPWNGSVPLIGMGNFTGNNKAQLKIINTVYDGPAISINTVYLLVMKMVFGATSTISLFVNPTPGGAEPAADVTQTGVGVPFSAMQWFGSNSAGVGLIDEIRFGSTWADVTPAVPTANSNMFVSFC